MRRLGGLPVGVAAKAPRTLSTCPSTQGQVDQVLGDNAPGALVCPKIEQTECQGACLQVGAPCPPAQPHPCQTVQFTVKALTVHSESTHNASTVQSVVNSLTMNIIPCYSETLISFSYS